jgi:osmotically-inducible protein OsmY
VKGVVDQISVAPVSGFDDDLRVAIARKIYGKLPIYANDPQAPIRIVVENGKVGLFGVVNSQVDKQVAESEARSTPGVFSVTNKLVVAGKQSM